MSDHADASFRDRPHGDPHAAVRDALPALLHGRVSAAERAELEGHLSACHACEREFRMLAAVRDLYAAPADTESSAPVAVDRIAAAVRARTVAVGASAAAPAPVARDAVVRTNAVPPRRAPAWARRGTLRAFAASALLAIGTGAVVFHQPTTAAVTRAAGAANAAPLAAAANAAPRDPNGSLLGASFSDLSDAELATLVAAVDDPAASAPAAEPAPVTPNVLAPDAE